MSYVSPSEDCPPGSAGSVVRSSGTCCVVPAVETVGNVTVASPPALLEILDPVGVVTDLVPNKAFSYVRHIVVGRGDTASMARAIAQLRGDPTGRISGIARARGPAFGKPRTNQTLATQAGARKDVAEET